MGNVNVAITAPDGPAVDALEGPVPVPARLPSWPLTALLGLIPVWWLSGFVDLIWMPMALVMAVYMVNAGNMKAPRGFGVWLLFLAWMSCSIVQVDSATHAIAFLYRAAIYVSATVFFLYVYNSGRGLSSRRVCGALTMYWLWAVIGGYLGVLAPNVAFKTPFYYVLLHLSPSVAGNDFVNHMVVRRLAQYNPDSYLGVAARPSAPFLYANNWGNAYSLLFPFVVAYLISVRGTRRFWFVLAAIVASPVPAFLTLNRGMLIGLVVAAVYVGFRLALRGHLLATAAILVAVVVGALLFNALAASRLETRLQGSGTSTRASLYQQSLDLVPQSPVFGYGVPPTSTDPNAPPVGTQGQFWLVLVSHGPVALAAFMGWFAIAFLRGRRRRDPPGVAAATVLLVSLVELGFYGVVPYGLPIMMIAAGLATRGSDA